MVDAKSLEEGFEKACPLIVAAGGIQHPADDLRQAEFVGAAELEDREIGGDLASSFPALLVQQALARSDGVQ